MDPGLALMAMAHNTGPVRDGGDDRGRGHQRLYRAVVLHRGAVYFFEQFPTALRGREHFLGEATGVVLSVQQPSFFGTIAVVVAGACNPLAFGKETVGQLELVTKRARSWPQSLLSSSSETMMPRPAAGPWRGRCAQRCAP